MKSLVTSSNKQKSSRTKTTGKSTQARTIQSEKIDEVISGYFKNLNSVCASSDNPNDKVFLFRKEVKVLRDALEDIMQKPIKDNDYYNVSAVLKHIGEDTLYLNAIAKNKKLSAQNKQEDLMINFISYYNLYRGQESSDKYESWAKDFIHSIQCIDSSNDLEVLQKAHFKE